MSASLIFPTLELMRSREKPELPFSWKPWPYSPGHEYLTDSRGRQLFIRNCAVMRKAGSTEIMWPVREGDEASR